MADKIEEKALALLNEVRTERNGCILYETVEKISRADFAYDEAICRAIEAHEADKQAFSDAVEQFNKRWADSNLRTQDWQALLSFIIKKPDPLVDVIKAAWPNASEHFGEGHTEETAEQLRKALAARGLKIVEANNAPL